MGPGERGSLRGGDRLRGRRVATSTTGARSRQRRCSAVSCRAPAGPASATSRRKPRSHASPEGRGAQRPRRGFPVGLSFSGSLRAIALQPSPQTGVSANGCRCSRSLANTTTRRWSSATTTTRDSEPSSRSTTRRWAPRWAACACSPIPPRRRRSTTFFASPRGMTYKAAIANVNLGGGKAVVIGDSRRDKNPALLRGAGRVHRRDGRRIHRGPGHRHQLPRHGRDSGGDPARGMRKRVGGRRRRSFPYDRLRCQLRDSRRAQGDHGQRHLRGQAHRHPRGSATSASRWPGSASRRARG